jgi:hypothetical protein
VTLAVDGLSGQLHVLIALFREKAPNIQWHIFNDFNIILQYCDYYYNYVVFNINIEIIRYSKLYLLLRFTFQSHAKIYLFPIRTLRPTLHTLLDLPLCVW